jgi:mannitol-1-phosphate/altronate dehydrogenase
LLAFEEVKLFGHNAIHALLGYLGAYKGYKKMSELPKDKQIMWQNDISNAIIEIARSEGQMVTAA